MELAENHTNACKKLLRKVRDCVIKAAITDFHIDSILVVMEHYSESWKDLAIFLASSRKLSVLDVVLASYYLSSPLQSFPYHLLVQAGIIVSLIISSGESPAARSSITSLTRTLVPLNVGFPWHI
ncbi:MAG: hypothetical protein ACP5KE_02695 [Candidatus Methanodesulfokora sp.]